MFLRGLLFGGRGRGGRRGGLGLWVVDVEGLRGGGSDGDDSRAEFYADGYVVVRGEAAFAEADGQLKGGC